MAQYTSQEQIRLAAQCLVDSKHKVGGLRDVFCVACGGSLGSLYPLAYLLRCESSSLHAVCITAGEFAVSPPRRLGANSVVLIASASGSTKEACDAAQTARQHGACVITISGAWQCPLRQDSDFHWVCSLHSDQPEEVCQLDMILALRFGFELLRLYDGYTHYDQALHGFEVLPDIYRRTRRLLAPRVAAFGSSHAADKVIYTVSAGPSFSVGYMESICHFMEMEWIHSFSIHAGELFHGPFEITDRSTPFIVISSNGPTRALDERALAFLQKYSGRVTWIDSNEFGVSQTGSEVEAYFSGPINWLAASCLDHGLEAAKNHPFMQRRYMGKTAY